MWGRRLFSTYPYVVGSRWYVEGRLFPTYHLPLTASVLSKIRAT